MKSMEHGYMGGTVGMFITLIWGFLAVVSKADVAVSITIMAGLTTVAVNLNRLYKDTRKLK